MSLTLGVNLVGSSELIRRNFQKQPRRVVMITFLVMCCVVTLFVSFIAFIVCGVIAGKTCRVDATLASVIRYAISWMAMSLTALVILGFISTLSTISQGGHGWIAETASAAMILTALIGIPAVLAAGCWAHELTPKSPKRLAQRGRKAK